MDLSLDGRAAGPSAELLGGHGDNFKFLRFPEFLTDDCAENIQSGDEV